jgi:hypothetical protein
MTFNQKLHLVMWASGPFSASALRSLLCISPAELAATERKRINDSIELRIWWVSNRFTSSNNQPGKNGHHSTKNNIWCCGRVAGPLSVSSLWSLSQAMGRELTTPRLSNCRFGWFQNDSLAPTINLAPEWPPVNPKITFHVVDENYLLCIIPTKVSANDVSLPMELVV